MSAPGRRPPFRIPDAATMRARGDARGGTDSETLRFGGFWWAQELRFEHEKKLVAKASVLETRRRYLLHITGYTYFVAAASVFAAVAGAGAANRPAAAALSLRCSAGVKATRWTRLCGNQPVCRVPRGDDAMIQHERAVKC